MARIFEPETVDKQTHDLLAMSFLRAHSITEHYKATGEGLEVNDGMSIKFIEDKEETDES